MLLSQEPAVNFRYYGISPWEIEVLYSYFNSKFRIIQEEIQQLDDDFVSYLELVIPLEFNERFFEWFDLRRWEKVKDLLKEMKRRRGSGNALKIKMDFQGDPEIQFIVDVEDKIWYNNAIEKMDFVLELLPYHLDPEKIPKEITTVTYHFDPKSARWRLRTALAGDKKFEHRGDNWRSI